MAQGGGEGGNFGYVKTGEIECGKLTEVLVSTESNQMRTRESAPFPYFKIKQSF